MVSSKKTRTLTLRVDAIPRLEARHIKAMERDPATHPDFGGFLNDLLDMWVDKEEFLEGFAPNLSVDHYTYNMMAIKDGKNGKIYEVYRYNTTLKCIPDESFDCDHVHFALAKLEVAKLNTRRRGR